MVNPWCVHGAGTVRRFVARARRTHKEKGGHPL